MKARKGFVVPVRPGQPLPPLPPAGLQSDADLARLPGAHPIDRFDIYPSPAPSAYAFVQQSVNRNLYRIPLP